MPLRYASDCARYRLDLNQVIFFIKIYFKTLLVGQPSCIHHIVGFRVVRVIINITETNAQVAIEKQV